jgi:hypothetical protein
VPQVSVHRLGRQGTDKSLRHCLAFSQQTRDLIPSGVDRRLCRGVTSAGGRPISRKRARSFMPRPQSAYLVNQSQLRSIELGLDLVRSLLQG